MARGVDLSTYEKARLGRALLDLATSVVPYVGLTALMYALYDQVSVLVVLALAIPTAGFLLRTFIVFHDCGHGSFFGDKRSNRWCGRLCALLVWQPFSNWRHDHAVHHGSAGDLDRRGTGDVPTLTVDEYYAKGWRGRLGYRLFRSPLVMFGLGPIYSLMIAPRLAPGGKRSRLRNSVLLTNLALGVSIAALCLLLGWKEFMLVQLPAAYLAAAAGVWLFYVQHQFDRTEWERDGDWNFHVASLSGSSYFKLPPILQWFSGNIGLHHVHHLCSRVPNYHLQACVEAAPELDRVTKVVTLRESVGCWRLALWDERRRVLVGFRDLQSGV